MKLSKNWHVVVIIFLLFVAIIGGYIYFTGGKKSDSDENNNKSSYTEHHFELQIEADNQTTVYWPIPYDSYNEGDEFYGNLSDLVYDLEITEGDGSIRVEDTKEGRALKITFSGLIRIRGNKKIYWDKDQNFNERKKYIFDDLTMRNTNKSQGETYFVYSSANQTEVNEYQCYRENVGKYDSSGTIGLYIEELTLKKGWQTMELSGNAPNYESP